MASKTDI